MLCKQPRPAPKPRLSGVFSSRATPLTTWSLEVVLESPKVVSTVAMVPVSPDVVVASLEEVSAPMLSEVSLAQPVLCQSVTSTSSKILVALPEFSELEAFLVLPELKESLVLLDPQVPPVLLDQNLLWMLLDQLAPMVFSDPDPQRVSTLLMPPWVSTNQDPQWVSTLPMPLWVSTNQDPQWV